MADTPKPPPPQRKFKVRTDVHRKTAEERAANIHAETLRQANQAQLQPSPTQHEVGRRTGYVQKDPRISTQNTGSVFSSTGAATSSRAKGSHTVSGTEELFRRAEGAEIPAVEAGTSRKSRAATRVGEKPANTAKRVAGKAEKSTAKKDDVRYVSDGESDGEEGKAVDIEDIDRISISSGEDDEEDDDIVLTRRRRIHKAPKANLGLRPVRAARDVLARGEGQNQAYTKAKKNGKEKEQSQADPDHGDTVDLNDEDGNFAVTGKQATPMFEDKAVPPSQSPTRRRRKSSTKDTRTQLETHEERTEREIYTSELRKLRNELSTGSQDRAPKEEGFHGAALTDPQDRRLYLFQFPPLTPMLIDPLHQAEVKVELSADCNAPTDPQVKKEGGTEAQAQPTTDPENPRLLTAANTPALPTGLAGKLHVHQSGKVTLDWGGGLNPTNLEVKWGSELDFLQDVVLTSSGAAGGGISGSKAWAMRQVRNKFVVVPDWGRIYE